MIAAARPGPANTERRGAVGLKTLILKPSSLGDVVQALPVLRLLKRAGPPLPSTGGFRPSCFQFSESDPDLAGVFAFQRRGWRQGRPWLHFLRSVAAMRAQHFDLVL